MLVRGMLYKVGMLVAQAVAFAILPVIAKYLGTEEYSIWSLSYAFVQLTIPYVMLQLDGAYTRFISGERDLRIVRDRFFSLMGFISLVGAFFASLLFWQAPRISQLIYGSGEHYSIVQILAIWIFSKTISGFSRNFFRTSGDFRGDFLLSLSQQVAFIVGIGIAVLFTGSIRSIFYSSIVVDLLGVVVAMGIIFKRTGFGAIQLRVPIEYWRYSLPLIPVATLAWTIDYSDQFFVAHLVGHDMNARYALYYLYARLPHWIIVTPWNYSFFPYISAIAAQDPNGEKVCQHVKEALTGALFVIGIAISMVVLFGGELVEVIGNQKCGRDSIGILAIVGVSVLFSAFYQITYHLISVRQLTHKVVGVFLGGAIANIALNATLIPTFGILGAATATTLSFFVIALLTLRESGVRLESIVHIRSQLQLIGLLLVIIALKILIGPWSLWLSVLLAGASVAGSCAILYSHHPEYIYRVQSFLRSSWLRVVRLKPGGASAS